MSEMLRQKVHEAALGQFDSTELKWIKPLLDIQKRRSHLPKAEELLIESFETEDGFHTVFYPFEGRFVHEGLAALVAYRIGKQLPISFSLAYNDYAFELLSDTPFELNESFVKELFSNENFEQDVIRGVNSAELANRRFREIAAIAGLVFKGFPGAPIRDRHLQSSSQLFFKVFEEYDPQNLLFRQAFDEVINFQLEMPRMRLSIARIETQKILIRKTEKPTPFAFPVMVDRLREKMSSEDLSQRIAKMVIWASN
jgi:ATP-dependent Lhr-like helicase